jgi:hypothetical protein
MTTSMGFSVFDISVPWNVMIGVDNVDVAGSIDFAEELAPSVIDALKITAHSHSSSKQPCIVVPLRDGLANGDIVNFSSFTICSPT